MVPKAKNQYKREINGSIEDFNRMIEGFKYFFCVSNREVMVLPEDTEGVYACCC